MADSVLKKKLEARRRAMDSTLSSKSPANVDDSQLTDQEIMEESIPEIQEEDKDKEELESALEQRRKKSRKILEEQERDESLQASSRLSRPSRVTSYCLYYHLPLSLSFHSIAYSGFIYFLFFVIFIENIFRIETS